MTPRDLESNQAPKRERERERMYKQMFFGHSKYSLAIEYKLPLNYGADISWSTRTLGH